MFFNFRLQLNQFFLSNCCAYVHCSTSIEVDIESVTSTEDDIIRTCFENLTCCVSKMCSPIVSFTQVKVIVHLKYRG